MNRKKKEKSKKERFFGPSPKLASDQMTLMASHKCPRSACNDIRRKTFLVFRHHFYQHFYHHFLSAFLFWRLKMWPGFLMLITSLLLRFLIRLKYLKIYEKIQIHFPLIFNASAVSYWPCESRVIYAKLRHWTSIGCDRRFGKGKRTKEFFEDLF